VQKKKKKKRIRDTYECVVLASFLQYCLTYLGGPVNVARYLIAKQHNEAASIITAKQEFEAAGKEKALEQHMLLHASEVNEASDDASSVAQTEDGSLAPVEEVEPELNWQQQCMGRMGCGHKKHKKVMTHQKHPCCCWLCCPCCPVWRPCRCKFSRPWALGAEFVRLTLLGTIQYIPCSLLVTILGIGGTIKGCYHEGHFTTDDVYFYNVIIRNWSQCWALYCLGMFYLVLHDELGAIRPVFKFSMIKIVVILMWDQQVMVAALEKSPMMKEADDGLIKRGWTSSEVGFCIQNFLCLFEMFFIGMGMSYAFHYTEWASDEVKERDKNVGPLCAFWHGKAVSTVKDFAHDTGLIAKKAVGRGGSRKIKVDKETSEKFGGALSTSAPSKTATNKDYDSVDVESGNDQFLLLPKLMTRDEIFVAARFVDTVSFMDVIRAINEINVLEKTLAATEPRAVSLLVFVFSLFQLIILFYF
jgi:hypothetical protein